MVLFSFTFHAKSKEILYCNICRPRITCSYSGSICFFFFSACSLIYHNSHPCHLKRFRLSLARKLYMKNWSQQKIHIFYCKNCIRLIWDMLKFIILVGIYQKNLNSLKWTMGNECFPIKALTSYACCIDKTKKKDCSDINLKDHSITSMIFRRIRREKIDWKSVVLDLYCPW